MNNIRTLLTPAMATYVIKFLYRITQTGYVSVAFLCAPCHTLPVCVSTAGETDKGLFFT